MTGKYLSTFLKATYVVFMFVGMVYFILIQGYKASFVFAACLTLFYSVLLYTVGKTDTNKTQAIYDTQQPFLDHITNPIQGIIGFIGVILYFLTAIFTAIALVGMGYHGGAPFYVNGFFALCCFICARFFCYIGEVKEWRIFDKYKIRKDTFTYDPEED